jgi:hypothetical protein
VAAAKLKNIRDWFPSGTPILSDADPKTGVVLKWRAKSGGSLIRIDGQNTQVKRDRRCLFGRSSPEKVHECSRGQHLLCKVYRWELFGHSEHNRSGELYVTRWFKTWSTAYQGRHIGGECDNQIYCIIVDGTVVHKPYEEQELSVVLPQTAAIPITAKLCIL